jgi:hypothetical protein
MATGPRRRAAAAGYRHGWVRNLPTRRVPISKAEDGAVLRVVSGWVIINNSDSLSVAPPVARASRQRHARVPEPLDRNPTRMAS